MSHSSSTPNFSRPLTSPSSTGGLDTPKRGSRSRAVLEEPPHTASLANMTRHPSARGLSSNKRLFNIPGGQPRGPAEQNGASPQGSPSTGTGRIRKLAKPNITSNNGSQSSVDSVDLGSRDKPIPNFRPHLWRHLDKERDVLNIDLFWPIKVNENEGEDEGNDDEDDDKDVFPYNDLKPLITYHNLRYLQVTGMMRSYQPLIFATCWVNKNLTHVRLEMALEPEMKPISKGSKLRYRPINDTWSYDALADSQSAASEYLGYHGEGTLHEEFGYGEYLDQQAIKAAQLLVGTELPLENLRFLPITHLTLKNFVVDAGPFFRWFDAKRLREVTFQGRCVDAGFYLPDDMKSKVKVNARRPFAVARWVKPGEVKLVEIKKHKPASSNGVGVGGPAMVKETAPVLGSAEDVKGKGLARDEGNCDEKSV